MTPRKIRKPEFLSGQATACLHPYPPAMSEAFFSVTDQDSKTRARRGTLRFGNPGDGSSVVETPVFMPVGTRGCVKAMWNEDLEEIGYRLILGNTYHLYLRPGESILADGLKQFMAWPHALLTDSGGYQTFSLSHRSRFHEEGVEFFSHLDGSRHMLTPSRVIDIQLTLGSDILMVLDDCPPGDASRERLEESLKRTHRWARISLEHFQMRSSEGELSSRLFGICQGGTCKTLRKESLDSIQSLPFAGIALGGLSVGEKREDFYETLEYVSPYLDPQRPRYLMGVGAISDLLEAVRHGVDMFDCVLPTRNARNGQIFTSRGRLNLRNAEHANRNESPDPDCSCRVCRRYSLAYLRHLICSGEIPGILMATYHNLYFYFSFMDSMKNAIRENRFLEFYDKWKKVGY